MSKIYKHKIGVERSILRAPSYMVSMRARIIGHIPAEEFEKAVQYARKRHPFLGVRVVLDKDSNGWFISNNVPEIPIRVRIRQDDSHWLRAIEKENRIPFNFEKGPLVRFVLINSPDSKNPITELIICCHHSICDGLSLCYIIRNLMSYLADPDYSIEPFPLPPPFSKETVPHTSLISPIIKILVSPINKKWEKKNIHFNDTDYRKLFNKFWKKNISILTWEIEQSKLTKLFARCKKENVSIHSALTVAFIIAQFEIEGSFQNYLRRYIMPVNIRNRMIKPVSEEMGFYVSALTINLRKIDRVPFWELAHKINTDIKKGLRNNRFIRMSNLHPSLVDALHFVQQGELNDKVARFVLRLLKWDQLGAGLEISNLGKLNFPDTYGPYRLSAIFGPVIYLPRVEKFIGITTVGDKMTFSCTYSDLIIDGETVKKIRDRVLVCLDNNV